MWFSFVVQICKMIISPGVFSMLKFWFSRLSGGWKGKKCLKMTKISVSCTLYFVNHISYDLHLLYTCMYEMIISRYLFLFFSSKFWLIYRIIKGVGWQKGKRWPKTTKHSVCLIPYLRNHTYDCDFWYICGKWCYL